MSLDWTVEKVKDYKTRCWRDSPMVEDEGKGRVVLEVDTYALVWGAMKLDLGGIRRNNIDEWDFRIRFCERLNLGWATLWDGEKEIAVFPTRQQIAEHVGLGTNVSTRTRQQWIKKIARSLERETEQLQQSNRQQAEKENEK